MTACAGEAPDPDRSALADAAQASDQDEAGDPDEDQGDGDADVDADDGPPGIEPVGALRRFDLVNPMCTIELLESGGGCPADDEKCLCRPEFDALNPAVGSPGNPDGRVILISQPRWGKRDDGTYAYDVYAAIKAQGNTVGHYENELNPSAMCTAAESWTGDKGCAGGSGCGWRCITGADWADTLVDQQIETYGDYPAPEAVSLNEAWSLIYDNDAVGIAYRTWIRDVTRQLKARGRLPLLFVQERSTAAGPYTLLSQTAEHALIMVESYVSGRQALAAPGACAPPYDASNFCYAQYRDIRNAIRNSASPPIPYDRLVMVEHFASNTFRYTDPQGTARTSGWGRAYDDDPGSPTFGTPTTSSWDLVIERRARAMKALPSLGGAGSYSWSGNRSGTGSSYRVKFAETYSAIALP